MHILLSFIIYVIKILCIVLPLMIAVAYYTYAERRIIGYMQDRIGPNRVGVYGLLQPFADAVKLLFKEIIFPQQSNKFMFIIAPMIVISTSLTAWAVVPFTAKLVLADINIGLLFVFMMTSIGVYGVIIAGWSSNSKYAFFSALRSAAQTISYEIAMGFSLVGVIMVAGSMNLKDIVLSQQGGLIHWYFIPLFPLMFVYVVSGVAETNRAPFDVVEGESEIVAGFHVEYSGMTFAVFFLAEYANMILISIMSSILFFGGWLSPFESFFFNKYLIWIPGIFWILLKTLFFMFLFLWLRATFPRYRYDRIMRLGWKILIPITLLWIFLLGIFYKFGLGPWF